MGRIEVYGITSILERILLQIKNNFYKINNLDFGIILDSWMPFAADQLVFQNRGFTYRIFESFETSILKFMPIFNKMETEQRKAGGINHLFLPKSSPKSLFKTLGIYSHLMYSLNIHTISDYLKYAPWKAWNMQNLVYTYILNIAYALDCLYYKIDVAYASTYVKLFRYLLLKINFYRICCRGKKRFLIVFAMKMENLKK